MSTPVEHKIGFDKSVLDGKVLVDDDKLLAFPAIIASEIVQQYEDGYAYKPAEALAQMADVANLIGARPVKILEHPGADTNHLLLKHSDVHGVVKNFQFVKNLLDAKTKRPCRRGVKADVYWFKDKVDATTLDAIRKGSMLDVSIGFTFDRLDESGEFEGQHYDYKQTNIFLDHLAAPIPAGRCPGPVCGIGYDSSMIRMDAKVLSDCPVCVHMRDVGWSLAGKRLYTAYGPDVLEVIEGNVLPAQPAHTVADTVTSDLDAEFAQAFTKWKAQLQNSQGN